jgi:hypothetical protein
LKLQVEDIKVKKYKLKRLLLINCVGFDEDGLCGNKRCLKRHKNTIWNVIDQVK